MTNTTKLIVYTTCCIGMTAGITYLIEELRHKNEILGLTNDIYKMYLDFTREMLKPAPRYPYHSRAMSYNSYNKEEKDETLA